MSKSTVLKGIGLTGKSAVGRVHVLQAMAIMPAQPVGEVATELRLLYEAVAQSICQVERIMHTVDGQCLAIMESHLSFLQDPEFIGTAARGIRGGASSLEAVQLTTGQLYETFRALKDTYMSERADDILDVGRRVACNLTGQQSDWLSALPQGTIVVARELMPSQAAQLDPTKTWGFVTAEGGETGHTAIMARCRGIAAVAGCEDILNHVNTGDELAVDGKTGQVIVSPDEETKGEYTGR